MADRLGYVFLDTGAMYRALALAALRDGVALDDAAAVARPGRSPRRPPRARRARCILDGEDVTAALRTQEVERRRLARLRAPPVRRRLVARQREMGARGRGGAWTGATSAPPSSPTPT